MTAHRHDPLAPPRAAPGRSPAGSLAGSGTDNDDLAFVAPALMLVAPFLPAPTTTEPLRARGPTCYAPPSTPQSSGFRGDRTPGENDRPDDRTSATVSALNSGENCRRCCPIRTPFARLTLACWVSAPRGEGRTIASKGNQSG
jgi:hypothetical protein